MVRKIVGKNPTNLGRSIIKAKHLNKNERRRDGRVRTAAYHNVDDEDEKEQTHLTSIMERNAMDEFLNTAMMKEQNFNAQKANIVMVGGSTIVQVQSKEAKEQLEYEHIRIPRRPKWDFNMAADELQRREREAFLAWRRDLAVYEEGSVDKHATPFEKNVEVWKQLWRVAERSHVVAQIVDARNPLLFFCQDLFALTKEMDARKNCVLVVNKSDFLTRQAREFWGKYFESQGIDYIFWSAKKETELLEAKAAADEVKREAREERRIARRNARKAAAIEEIKAENARKKAEKMAANVGNLSLKPKNTNKFAMDDDEDAAPTFFMAEDDDEEIDLDDAQFDDEEAEEEEEEDVVIAVDLSTRDPYEVVGHQELLDYLRAHADMSYVRETYELSVEHRNEMQRLAVEEANMRGFKLHEKKYTQVNEKIIIGMLGFPNVGKSSTINALIGAKKVSVAATPGHTKHFQTLNLGEGLVLCDCPGLVFPTFVHSKASLVVNGVIPIDTLRDFITPVEAMCHRISRSQVTQVYGLDIPAWKKMDAATLLQSYARMRGFFSNNGRPDEQKCARVILKDFVAGKLLYCQCPPNITKEQRKVFYQSYTDTEELFSATNPNSTAFTEPSHVVKTLRDGSDDNLNFEAETEFLINQDIAQENETEEGLLEQATLEDGFVDDDRDVINVKISRQKIVTVEPEVEKLGVFEKKRTRKEALTDLANTDMTKKQARKLRKELHRGKADVLGADISKKGSAGLNTAKFYGAVFQDGKKVKQ